MSHTEERGQGAVSNILAVAGFIILIAIVVWGAFHFLNLASSGFSSLWNRSGSSTIAITLSNRNVNSGQPLDVSWQYSPSAEGGSYALLYQCRDGFQFRSVTSSGVVNPIPCGSAFTLGDQNVKNIRLIPALSGTSSLDVPFTIMYMQSGTTSTSTPTSRPQGSAMVSVSPSTGSATTPPAGSQPIGSTLPPTGTTPTPTPAPTGKPDLSVRIIAVGVIDPYTGQFVNRAPTSQTDVVAVKFDIANNGETATGAWHFTAQLPTQNGAPYVSPQQASLAKGAHIENTLRFNTVATGGGNFTVTVDPTNIVGESNESNNYVSQWVSGGYGYTPNPYPYPTQYPYVY